MYCRYCGELMENGVCKACKQEREKRQYSKVSLVLCLASILIPLFGLTVGIFNIASHRKIQGIIYLVCAAMFFVFILLYQYVPGLSSSISEFLFNSIGKN